MDRDRIPDPFAGKRLGRPAAAADRADARGHERPSLRGRRV